MTKTRGLARRTFLRGALATGAVASIGLPLLDAMTNLGGTAHADGSPLPQRFAVWFWGNGMILPQVWSPTGEGASWTPSAVLRGLAPVQDRVTVVSNTILPTRFQAHLDGNPMVGNNPHVEGVCGILTGGNPYLEPGLDPSRDWDFMSPDGPSIDQVMVDVVGRATFPSLTMSVLPLGGGASPGTALHYISHRGARDPIVPVPSPWALFDQVFGGGLPTTVEPPTREELARASVLDAVLDDARSLRGRLGAYDRGRLDQHLTQIREVETRLRGDTIAHPGVSCTLGSRPEDPGGEAYRERARSFATVVALAFACDLTRVASVCFSEPGAQSAFREAVPGGFWHSGVQTSLHEYEHLEIYHPDAPNPNILAAHQYMIDCYADFVQVLDSMEEVGGTVLDRSAVLGTTETTKGETHDTDNFPLLVAGGAGGLRPGLHVRAPAGSIATQVPFTIMKALGSTATSWGRDQFETSEELPLRG
jgi:hypothetical protein